MIVLGRDSDRNREKVPKKVMVSGHKLLTKRYGCRSSAMCMLSPTFILINARFSPPATCLHHFFLTPSVFLTEALSSPFIPLTLHFLTFSIFLSFTHSPFSLSLTLFLSFSLSVPLSVPLSPRLAAKRSL